MTIKSISRLIAVLTVFIFSSSLVKAQGAKPDTTFKPSGNLWGYVFGDYAVKTHSDSANRGGSNQYTNVAKTRNAFQIRRVYVGYDYTINKKYSD